MSRLISLGLVMDCSVNWMRNVLISSAMERGKSFNINISYIHKIYSKCAEYEINELVHICIAEKK